jgi:diguanylate cyclase (GGDEF)-like protein/PAS domain S-box-containing protein
MNAAPSNAVDNTIEPIEAPDTPPAPRRSPWARLHAALMPDYNRKATVYWWTTVLLGLAVIAHSLMTVAAMPLATLVQAGIGTAIAMLAGFFPVRIPRSKNSFAAGEIFIFLLLMIHGPAPAALAAGGEALIGACRTSKRWTSRIASPTIAALAMFIAGSLLQALLDAANRFGLTNPGMVVVAAMVFSLTYFVFNTTMVSSVPRLKRNERFQVSDLVGVFGWIGIAYAGSAAVAALLYLTVRQSGIGVLVAVLPIIVMLLATLHYYFRQQEAQDAARNAADKATEREAELASRHLQELQASERRFHSAFTHASIGMALLSFDGEILQANAALRTLIGIDDDGLRRHAFQTFVGEPDVGLLEDQLARVNRRESENFAIELRCRHSNGQQVWVAAHCSFFSEPGSTSPCLILQAQDITARRQAEAGLHHLAFHDSLTGLPNRRRFRDLLAQAVERSRHDARQHYAVMFLDFDRFKLINDSLGHNAGDDFLVQVSRCIQEKVRTTDIVARLGGDEFAILLQHLDNEHEAVVLAERLLHALGQPFLVAGTELTASASIGITVSSIGYATPEEALRDADIAMYKAKAAGKARYALFDVGLHAEAKQRLRLEGDLRHAVADGTLSVAYQPLFDLASAQLIGFEALARWNHPEHGAIGPEVFIPVAEETGLIVPITDFVLHRACHQLKAWQVSDPAFAALTMHVNISGKDIAGNGLVARVTHAIVEARLLPQHVTLELTENILMERLETALPMLTELRALGVGLSVDDFGTGYSSLAHLSSLPIDSLKVDRSFVRGLRTNSKEATIVRAIVHLGNSLGKRVIAEGVETPSQFAQLKEMGCQLGQGLHMSGPLEPLAADALLTRTLLARTLTARAPGPARFVPARPAFQLH